MNGKYDIAHDVFFKLTEGAIRRININYLRKDLDLILVNFVSVIELWINGTLYLHDVLIAAI